MRLRLQHLYADLGESLAELGRDHGRVRAARQRIEEALASGAVHYGINTGLGILARERIPSGDVEKLQRNLLLSHAVGVGPYLAKDICRLMLQIKIHALGLGHSGVSEDVFARLLEFSARDLIPAVPSKGSVGASGDLAPLAHLSLPLLGLGVFWDEHGREPRQAAAVLRRLGLSPVKLHAKDGLSLINGTQMMCACGAFVLERALRLALAVDILAAMSLEALQGSLKPFDARLQELRPHPGQIAVAENVRTLLAESEILESHRDCGKVQDPYCLRCVPQVHGASRDAIAYGARVLEIELNSSTDNPLVLENGDILSGGNFHGQPLAMALDFAALALAEWASISERRIYLLLEGHDGLPRLLMRNVGTNSGFMIPQYTAAALVSENKVLAHPAVVDSIPTSLGQEDHVSMGSISALKLMSVLENVEYVLAIELLTAAQALDYRLPLRPGRGVEAVHRLVRERIPHAERDRLFHKDIEAAVGLIRGRDIERCVLEAVGPLQPCQ